VGQTPCTKSPPGVAADCQLATISSLAASCAVLISPTKLSVLVSGTELVGEPVPRPDWIVSPLVSIVSTGVEPTACGSMIEP